MAAAFANAKQDVFTPEVQNHGETVEHNGGRRERSTGTVLDGPGLCEWVVDLVLWPGLCSLSLIRVDTERHGSQDRR